MCTVIKSMSVHIAVVIYLLYVEEIGLTRSGAKDETLLFQQIRQHPLQHLIIETLPPSAECSSLLTMGTWPRWSAATWTAPTGPGWWIIKLSSPLLWHWMWSRSWCTGQTPTWITSMWWIITAGTGTPLSMGAK